MTLEMGCCVYQRKSFSAVLLKGISKKSYLDHQIAKDLLYFVILFCTSKRIQDSFLNLSMKPKFVE